MGKIILVTGGARSGKSQFAEQLSDMRSEKICYIATSESFDDEMKDRIKKHIAQRPSHWETIEAYKNLGPIINSISNSYDLAMLDCVTVMINNLMFHSNIDFEKDTLDIINEFEKRVIQEIGDMLIAVKSNPIDLVVVTNEIGLGIVPGNRYTRIYRDIVGRANQFIAKQSDEVHLIVSGINIKIK